MCVSILFNKIVSLSLSLSLFLNHQSIDDELFLEGGRSLLMVMGFFLDKCGVFFVRWFREPFFEQVVFALGLLVIPSESDVSPEVKRHFRLFD